MSTNAINAFILSGLFLLLFALGELLYYKGKVKAEISRKVVHIGTGLLALLFPLMLHNHWLVLFLCVAFFLILLLSHRYRLLKSIHGIERKSFGSYAYPFAVYGCYLAYALLDENYIYYYLPIVILAICDPLAALIGKKWPRLPYRIGKADKTGMGSFMFMLSAIMLTASYFFLFLHLPFSGAVLFAILAIALFATIAEAISWDGFDNLSIPAVVIGGLLLFKPVLLC